MKRTKKPDLGTQLKRHSKRIIKEPETHINPNDLMPTGSTLLNLAMSDTIEGGVKKGTMINIIGASHGGKTMLALTSFAEANIHDKFKLYDFIYDDIECANSFDMPKLFGKKTAEKIRPPRPDKVPNYSPTVQHLHANILYNLKQKNSIIYVLDSFDALDALEDQKKIQDLSKAIEDDTKTKGTYGMAKAKASSSILRSCTGLLSSTGSILIIVSQIRDNVDPMSPKKDTRSGGHALKFYAHHEMWMKPIKEHKKKGVVIGNTIIVKITKNKITGKKREVKFDIYNDYGIDDIGSCIDYLIEIGRWSGGGTEKIKFGNDFDFENCTKAKLFKEISESSELYNHLKLLVKEEWTNFEDSIKLNRKPKYE